MFDVVKINLEVSPICRPSKNQFPSNFQILDNTNNLCLLVFVFVSYWTIELDYQMATRVELHITDHYPIITHFFKFLSSMSHFE